MRRSGPRTVRFHATDIVRATSSETFAWWTDLEETDAGAVMPPLRRRQIVRRTATEIETDDRWSIFGIPELELRWPWTWAAIALRPALARMFQDDLEAVNRELERSLTSRASGSASPTPPSSGSPSGLSRRS